MNDIDIKNLKVAKRYSTALIEVSKENTDEICSNLESVSELFKTNNEFKLFFSHPAISLTDKKDTLRELFSSKINSKTIDFLNILLEENRFSILNTIFEVFKEEVRKYKNQQSVSVTSAIELQEDEKERIKQKLSEKLKKEIILACDIKEDILGGLIIKINDKIVDLSLKTKFDNLKKYN